MLAQLCVQRLLVLPLLCQVADEQGDLRIASTTSVPDQAWFCTSSD